MIVRQFLLWARNAPPGHRAEATAALAKAYLYSELSAEDRWEAETALTAMLDDPAAVVRRAMAESLAKSPDAPRHLIVALAADAGDIAGLVLARSPVLIDADLVDAVALGSENVQCAVASRPWVSPPVCAALAEIGRPVALVSLARNAGAEIGDAALARMVERHGADPAVREAMLARADLPADIVQALAAALAENLANFVVECGWLTVERTERVTREARERTAIALSARSDDEEVERLVAYLRTSSQLTPALMLRAILSCETAFVEAAFAELAGMSIGRTAAILRDARGQSFRALYARAGLPAGLRDAFESALYAARNPHVQRSGARATLSRAMIEEALRACGTLPPDQASRLVALLRRFEVEAAREEARRVAGELADEAALHIVMRHAPEALSAGEPPRAALAA